MNKVLHHSTYDQSLAKAEDSVQQHVISAEKIIVIGAGPVGIRFAEELLKRNPHADITLFGNEPYQPYNRVQLSSLLAGEVGYDDIITRLPDKHSHPKFRYIICAIKHIDPSEKTVRDANEVVYRFDKLIFACGSRPHVPNIPGVDQTGVYTFRNLKDAEFLYARISRARHVIVLGGGLLGLEAARALLRANTQVTLVQQGQHLMNRQLDEAAATLLRKKVESMGIRVITNSGVRQIKGEVRVTGVVTRDNETIDCDTVLVCAGIKPNVELARAAKIKVATGILVDDTLKTSNSDIYAIGECCEHRGLTYGLVNPGFEQAAVAAESICYGSSHYSGSLSISQLKVVGEYVCSMGEITEAEKEPLTRYLVYRDNSKGVYRKVKLYKGRIVSAVGIGEWDESRRIQEAYQNGRRVWPWQSIKFLLNGKLFSDSKDDVNLWPQYAVVCQCNNISQGELVDALNRGCTTVAELQKTTRAGTVCGSCKPLLNQLCAYSGPLEKEKAWMSTLIASGIAVFLACLILYLPALTVSDSVITADTFAGGFKGTLEGIWNDKYWKQVSGFSLLGLSIIGLLMSLRKKMSSQRLGDYRYWRVLHIILGMLCASILILHTGLHFGENLNQVLMIDFIGILLLGGLAGAVVSLSHVFSAASASKIRKFWTWAHILFTWPFPILIGFHILTVYYF